MYFFHLSSHPHRDRCSTAKKSLLCHSAYFGSQRHNVAELQNAERIHMWWNYFIEAAERSALPKSSLERLLYMCLCTEVEVLHFWWKGKKKKLRIRIQKTNIAWNTKQQQPIWTRMFLPLGNFNMWPAQGKSSQERMVVSPSKWPKATRKAHNCGSCHLFSLPSLTAYLDSIEFPAEWRWQCDQGQHTGPSGQAFEAALATWQSLQDYTNQQDLGQLTSHFPLSIICVCSMNFMFVRARTMPDVKRSLLAESWISYFSSVGNGLRPFLRKKNKTNEPHCLSLTGNTLVPW